MIKLKDILLEIQLEEKIVKVSQAVLAKSKEAFNYIKNNLERFKDRAPKDYFNPDIDAKFKDYFKLKDLNNQDLMVSIGFYNDPKDVGAGRMDTANDILLLNLAYFNPENFPEFLEILEHELVHAMDPKVRDQRLFGVMYAKKGAEPGGSRLNISKSGGKSEFETNLDKYYKSPWEFDAFTAPLINTIKFSLQKIQDPNLKQEYKKLINNLLSDIKTKNIDQISNDAKYEKLPWFFSKQKWDAKNSDIVVNTFNNELSKIKSWSSEPKLYQRFTKRLGQEIT
jgi:hypothetical protein